MAPRPVVPRPGAWLNARDATRQDRLHAGTGLGDPRAHRRAHRGRDGRRPPQLLARHPRRPRQGAGHRPRRGRAPRPRGRGPARPARPQDPGRQDRRRAGRAHGRHRADDHDRHQQARRPGPGTDDLPRPAPRRPGRRPAPARRRLPGPGRVGGRRHRGQDRGPVGRRPQEQQGHQPARGRRLGARAVGQGQGRRRLGAAPRGRLRRAVVRAPGRGPARGQGPADRRRRPDPGHRQDREAAGGRAARRDHRGVRRHHGGARRPRGRDGPREGAAHPEADHRAHQPARQDRRSPRPRCSSR